MLRPADICHIPHLLYAMIKNAKQSTFESCEENPPPSANSYLVISWHGCKQNQVTRKLGMSSCIAVTWTICYVINMTDRSPCLHDRATWLRCCSANIVIRDNTWMQCYIVCSYSFQNIIPASIFEFLSWEALHLIRHNFCDASSLQWPHSYHNKNLVISLLFPSLQSISFSLYLYMLLH